MACARLDADTRQKLHTAPIQSIAGHQNLKEIETYTKAVEQATLAKTAMASVTKAFPNRKGLTDLNC